MRFKLSLTKEDGTFIDVWNLISREDFRIDSEFFPQYNINFRGDKEELLADIARMINATMKDNGY